MRYEIHWIIYEVFFPKMFNLNLIKPLDLSSSLQKLQELGKEGKRQSQGKSSTYPEGKVGMLPDN